MGNSCAQTKPGRGKLGAVPENPLRVNKCQSRNVEDIMIEPRAEQARKFSMAKKPITIE